MDQHKESFHFKHYSFKSRDLLRRLDLNSRKDSMANNIMSDNIAKHIRNLIRLPCDKMCSRKVRKSINQKREKTEDRSRLVNDFIVEEISKAIQQRKTGKASDVNSIFHEFIMYYGPSTQKWLTTFHSNL